MSEADDHWTVSEGEAGGALASFVREKLGGRPWRAVKELVGSGKIFVDGQRVTEDGYRVRAGEQVALRMRAPRAREGKAEVHLVHDDSQVVVIDKPSGVSSVPYDEKETGTAMDLIRDAWRRQGKAATSTPLHVVHRIDKDTSGLLCFAKTKKAERALAMQFRGHTVERTYVCVAHGAVRPGTIESRLVEDRGDGLRGSTKFSEQGKRAVTHVSVSKKLPGASLLEVRLETGKTHQIRIHLAEAGHPLVGERVYVRDFEASGGQTISSPRLLLHAATLGFQHPGSGETLRFESELPEDFRAVLRRLEG